MRTMRNVLCSGAVALAGGVGSFAHANETILAENHRMLAARAGTELAAGDFDGDSSLDLVVAGFGRDFALVNDGKGRLVDFGALPPPPTSSLAADVATGDVNGDGHADLWIANGESAGLTQHPNELYLGHGDGTFTLAPGLEPSGGHNSLSIELVDVDGDGDRDLILGGGTYDDPFPPSTSPVYTNDGAGGFSLLSTSVLPNEDVTDLEALDFDGDLDADLLASAAGGPYLLENDGSGNFTDVTALALPSVPFFGPCDAAVGDLDGDGDPDAVVTFGPQGTQVYRNIGGTFALGIATVPSSGAIALADVDGDRDLDLWVGRSFLDGGGLRLLSNDGAASYTDVTDTHVPPDDAVLASATAIVASDVDGDGDTDVAYARGLAPARLLLNDGRGVHSADFAGFGGSLAGAAHGAVVANLDGGSFDDVVFATQGGVQLFGGLGDGTFVDGSTGLPGGPDPAMSIGAGDFDEDGHLDLYVGNGHPFNQVEPDRLLLGIGGGTFTDASANLPAAAANGNTHDVAVGDVDGDGHLDALLGSCRTQTLLFLGDGAGGFVDATNQVPVDDMDSTSTALLVDVDVDGDLDAFLVNFGEPNRLWRNDGGGVFTDVTNTKLPVTPFELAQDARAGDVDADGDVDIVVVNLGTGGDTALRLYVNDGTGRFSDGSSAFPRDWEQGTAVELADFDGDDDLDVLAHGLVEHRYYVNDGAGAFTDATADVDAHLPDARALATGDLDVDGDLDLVAGARTGQGRLFSNLAREVAYTTLPRAGHDLCLEISGDAGGAFVLLGSLGGAYVPLGALGVLQIDRTTIFARSIGALGSDGAATAVYAVPPDPMLIGRTLHWQALVHPPRALTNVDRTTIVGF